MQNGILSIEEEENHNLEPNCDGDPEIEAENNKRTIEHSRVSLKRRRLTHDRKLQVLPVHSKFPKITAK